MKPVFFVMLIAILGFIAASQIIRQDSVTFPPGPSRELFLRHCTGCHDTGPILNRAPLNRAQWEGVLLWMQKMHGMPAPSEADKGPLLEYLSLIKAEAQP